MRRKISQSQARWYSKEVKRLSGELATAKYRANLAEHYGTKIDTINVNNAERWIVETATRLKHIVVIRPVTGADKVDVYAVKP